MRGGTRLRPKHIRLGSRSEPQHQDRRLSGPLGCVSLTPVSWMSLRVVLVTIGLAFAGAARAVVEAEAGSGRVDFREVTPIQVLPAPPSLWTGAMQEITVGLRPSVGTIRRRLEATLRAKPFAEPLRLRVTSDLRVFLRGLALPGMRALLEPQLAGAPSPENHVFVEAMQGRVSKGVLELDARDLSWLDLSLLSQHIETASRVPRFTRKAWHRAMDDDEQRGRLQQFFGYHWDSVAERVSLDAEQAEISNTPSRPLAPYKAFGDKETGGRPRGELVRAEEGAAEARESLDPLELVPESDETWVYLVDLLPEHMQDLFGRFSSYRGRNCFATALQFDTPGILADRSVNLVREEEHHAAMINSDEFAHALWRAYTPLTEAQIDEGLRFGDLVVFFDEFRDPGYRSLLHTAVHVGGRYYFHKPSKSASSPVEFTRWDDMIRVWRKHAKRLGYQVYRRNPAPMGRYADPRALAEKINWTP